MTDELLYERLAINAAHTFSPLPAIHGHAVGNMNQLYPLLIAPLFGHGNVADSLTQAHVLNAIVMASAALPVFALAREMQQSRRLGALCGRSRRSPGRGWCSPPSCSPRSPRSRCSCGPCGRSSGPSREPAARRRARAGADRARDGPRACSSSSCCRRSPLVARRAGAALPRGADGARGVWRRHDAAVRRRRRARRRRAAGSRRAAASRARSAPTR